VTDGTDATGHEDTVALPRSELDSILARLRALEDQSTGVVVASCGDEPGEDPPAVRGADVPSPPRLLDRRRALSAVVAGAAGTAAALAAARPAAAANGSSLILGNNANSATAATGLAIQGTSARYGLGVTDNGLASEPSRAALLGHAKGQSFSAGVLGVSESPLAIAIDARSASSLALSARSESGRALQAASISGDGASVTTESSTATALYADGGRYAIVAGGNGGVQLYLRPRQKPITDPSITAEPGVLFASGGRLSGTGRVSSTLWSCVYDDGETGEVRWRVLSGPTTAGSLHVLPVPARIYDSRPGSAPSVGLKTPLRPSEIRTLDLKVNGSTVPAGATAAVLTVLLVNAANASGNFTVWAGGAARPAANTMVWGGSAGRFCTSALTAVDAQARVQVSASASTNLVIDVVGYYR
jgi:hypothetical protein